LRRLLARFRRSENGATAIQFGIVATPFLAVLFAIFEMTMMLWTNQILEEALSQASRSLLTGQATAMYRGSASANTTAFRNAVCANASNFVDCTKLSVDVRNYANFASAQTGTASSSPVSGGAMNTSGFGYQSPQPGQIIVVRAALEYSLYFTTWSNALANIGTGKRALVASTTFRAEPFTPTP
jgi:pilus assembly protein Flp/PilA